MANDEAYFYVLLRFVPDALIGEFVNVGYVVGDGEGSEWRFYELPGKNRARCLDSVGCIRSLDVVNERMN